jgi:hypothetical protein
MLPARRPCVVNTRGIPFSMVRRPGRGRTLVVLLHGAIDRQQRPIPFFQSFFDVSAPQISISDPTLTRGDALTTGWYLGREGENLPSILSMTIKDISVALDCRRRIYVGASAGGFAALNLAHRDSNGLAIAVAAQTNLATHSSQSKVKEFIGTAWPSYRESVLLPEAAGTDLVRMYGGSDSGSSAICIYSSGDTHHIQRQMAPFVSALLPNMLDRFVLDIGYWGRKGHSGSVPPHVVKSWIAASLISESHVASSLRDVYYRLTADRIPNAHAPISLVTEDASREFHRDIETARKLSFPENWDRYNEDS